MRTFIAVASAAVLALAVIACVDDEPPATPALSNDVAVEAIGLSMAFPFDWSIALDPRPDTVFPSLAEGEVTWAFTATGPHEQACHLLHGPAAGSMKRFFEAIAAAQPPVPFVQPLMGDERPDHTMLQLGGDLMRTDVVEDRGGRPWYTSHYWDWGPQGAFQLTCSGRAGSDDQWFGIARTLDY